MAWSLQLNKSHDTLWTVQDGDIGLLLQITTSFKYAVLCLIFVFFSFSVSVNLPVADRRLLIISVASFRLVDRVSTL